MYGGGDPTDIQGSLAMGSQQFATLVLPHHPITCTGALAYEEDGTMTCPHAKVSGDDLRALECVTHSITLLMMEIASKTL